VVPLPPWSPDLTPIEEMVSKVKGAMRTAAARTTEAAYEAFAWASHDVTLEDIAGGFQDRAADAPGVQLQARSRRYPGGLRISRRATKAPSATDAPVKLGHRRPIIWGKLGFSGSPLQARVRGPLIVVSDRFRRMQWTGPAESERQPDDLFPVPP